eukprot:5061639-Karenia_brevis.AAC.1
MSAELVAPGEICMICDGQPTQGAEIMTCGACMISQCMRCLSPTRSQAPTQIDEEDANMSSGAAGEAPSTALDSE